LHCGDQSPWFALTLNVQNVYAPTENKSDDTKGNFMRNQSRCLITCLHFTQLLGDFNAKLGREDNFKLTIGKEILYKDSNDYGVTVHSYSKIFTNKPGTLIIKKNSQSD